MKRQGRQRQEPRRGAEGRSDSFGAMGATVATCAAEWRGTRRALAAAPHLLLLLPLSLLLLLPSLSPPPILFLAPFPLFPPIVGPSSPPSAALPSRGLPCRMSNRPVRPHHLPLLGREAQLLVDARRERGRDGAQRHGHDAHRLEHHHQASARRLGGQKKGGRQKGRQKHKETRANSMRSGPASAQT